MTPKQAALHRDALYRLDEYRALQTKMQEMRVELMEQLLDAAKRSPASMDSVKYIAGQIDMLEQCVMLPESIWPATGEHNGTTREESQATTDEDY